MVRFRAQFVTAFMALGLNAALAAQTGDPPACPGCGGWSGPAQITFLPGSSVQYVKIEVEITNGVCVLTQPPLEGGGGTDCVHQHDCVAVIKRSWSAGWAGTHFAFRVETPAGRVWTMNNPPQPTSESGSYTMDFPIECGWTPFVWSLSAGSVSASTTGGCNQCDDV